MDNHELKNRIKELELELSNLKSSIIAIEEKGRQAKKALLEKGDWYRLLFNNVSDAVFVHEVSQDISDTEKFKIIEVNNNACKYLGYTREELLQINVPEIDAPESLENASANLNILFIEGRTTWEGIHMHKDGHRIPVEISLQLFELNGKPMVLSSVRDITERKQAEQTLKESENKYRTLVENIGEGLGLVNPDEVFVFANPAAERIFGVGTGELIGKNLKEFLDEQQYLEVKNQTRLREKGQSGVYENELTLPNGKKQNIIITAVPQFDDNKKFIGTYAIFRDITEEKQAEEEIMNMKEALGMINQRLEEISDNERVLFSEEIHDQLGQSLVALKYDIHWLSGKFPSDSEEDKVFHGMNDLLSTLIINVQRISSTLHPAMLDEIGLYATIEWYSEDFEERTGINCILKLDDVQFPEKRKNLAIYRILQEALTNILLHAKAKNVSINLYQAEDSIIMEVVDDGIGIEKKKINSYKSLGIIGMRERIKPYNGKLDISSTKDKGTKLAVSMPVN